MNLRCFALALLPSFAAACDTSVSPTDSGQSVSPVCREAESERSQAWLEANVFAPSCAASAACHVGSAPSAGGLDLTSGGVSAAVGRPSMLFPEYELVAPSRPDDSYLLIIMGGAQGPIDDAVGLMPARNEPLCEPILGAVRRWISDLPPR